MLVSQMEHSALETRTALLNAALACFAEHGFDGTSIRMIAQRAKRPLSLLSHHFGNKEELYLEVFKLMFENTIQVNQEDRIPADGYSPKDKGEAIRMLREQIHCIYRDVVLNNRHQDPVHDYSTRLWLQEVHSPRPSLVPIISLYMHPRAETIQKCIQTLRPDIDECQAVFLGISILGLVAGHGLMQGLNQVVWKKTKAPESQFQVSEWLVDLCINGLVGGSPQGQGPSAG
jgi:AcrR family transcriptional regulator